MRTDVNIPAIGGARFIQNFNRYSAKNRTAFLNALASKATEDKILKPNPDWVPHYPIVVEVGGVIIIIVSGPKPRPKYTPCVIVLKEAFEKATKFERYLKGGVQHLIVMSPDTKVEILAMPD